MEVVKKILGNRIVKNAGWLIAGKIVQMLLSLIIGILSARYLGPGNYGIINYAAAYTTCFASFCTLGINSVIVKNFIDHPEEEGETLGTTLLLRLISSLLSLGVIVGFVSIVDRTEPLTLVVVTLYCISLVFHIFDTFNYWFQARLLSKFYAIATLVAYVVTALYRVILLMQDRSVEWFAIANSVDYCIVAALLLIFYKINGGPKLTFSIRKSKELLRVSCSYILSGLMVAVYSATDKLMLKQMMSEESVGYYSLAVTISTMWTFVLSAIIDSMKPSITRYYNDDKSKYVSYNKRLYAIVFYLSMAASLGITIIAPWFVRVLYGEEFIPTVNVVRTVVWYVTFSYLGVARDTWVVCEGKQKYLKYLYISSAAINILLNAIFIPLFGALGAAGASVFTQMANVFLIPLLIKEFRPNVYLMLRAISIKGAFGGVNNSTRVE